jgi:hypothetical protein
MRKLREKDSFPHGFYISTRGVLSRSTKRLFAVRAAWSFRLRMLQDAQCKDGVRLYGEFHGVLIRAERKL